MKQKRLIQKSLWIFFACLVLLFLLAIPLFYWLTKSFYAEEMHDVLKAVQSGQQIPELDLEEDIAHGVMLQFGIIAGIVSIAMVLVTGLTVKRLWKPFDDTLQTIERFRIDRPVPEPLPETSVREFTRLNTALNRLMADSMAQYRLQKEFTENASHELQTPLAVLQGRLDLLLQDPDLTGQQAAHVQDMYGMTRRMARLNRNLLLLAKMENRQFETRENIDINALIGELQPYWQTLADGLTVEIRQVSPLCLPGNKALVETLLNNLVINAIRHNMPQGRVSMQVNQESIRVTNTSAEPALDKDKVFTRFYQPADRRQNSGDNGLGLAIAKAVCDYHGWHIAYAYTAGQHSFTVLCE